MRAQLNPSNSVCGYHAFRCSAVGRPTSPQVKHARTVEPGQLPRSPPLITFANVLPAINQPQDHIDAPAVPSPALNHRARQLTLIPLTFPFVPAPTLPSLPLNVNKPVANNAKQLPPSVPTQNIHRPHSSGTCPEEESPQPKQLTLCRIQTSGAFRYQFHIRQSNFSYHWPCYATLMSPYHTAPPLRCKQHQETKLTLHQTSCNRIPLVLPLVPPQPLSLAFFNQRMDPQFFWGCLGVAHPLFWGGPAYLNFSSFFVNHGFDKTVGDAINSMKNDPLPQ